ncbi:hypothetical protein Glove_91g112 [Diversispora epigaea]|uniref:DNA-directed DNA polymerase n=1 Tax=Diversispora epigaea TaxID=1348612 RepID=A0A397J7W4_9GLOM|nr:hypothetical protein Glove_91g112 [Diversispora epigaea]
MLGGIIWADNEWKGFGRQYDETSLYPSIMQSAFTFPIKKGKFQTLQDFINHRGYILYGIFRAKVEFKEDIKMLFRYNKHNKYTHIDLSYAKELGLQVILIQDNAPNALIYEKETRIPGEVINKSYYNISDVVNLSKPFDYPEDKILESIIPTNNTSWTFQFSNPNNLFKGEYPRIAPFILAQGRKIISKTIEPYKDKVKRVHTDGFILSEDPIKVKPHAICGITSPLINCPKDASVTLKALKFEKEDQYDYINGELVRRNNTPPRRLRSYFFNTITHRRIIGGERRYFELVNNIPATQIQNPNAKIPNAKIPNPKSQIIIINNRWDIENDYYLVSPLVISDPDPDSNPDAVRRNPVTFEGLISVHGESLAKCNMTLCRECFIPITLGINEYCEEHQ